MRDLFFCIKKDYRTNFLVRQPHLNPICQPVDIYLTLYLIDRQERRMLLTIMLYLSIMCIAYILCIKYINSLEVEGKLNEYYYFKRIG